VPSDASAARLCRAAASGAVERLSIDTDAVLALDYAGEPREATFRCDFPFCVAPAKALFDAFTFALTQREPPGLRSICPSSGWRHALTAFAQDPA